MNWLLKKGWNILFVIFLTCFGMSCFGVGNAMAGLYLKDLINFKYQNGDWFLQSETSTSVYGYSTCFSYSYDDSGHLILKEEDDDCDGSVDEEVTYTWNDQGELVRNDYSGGAWYVTYNSVGQIIELEMDQGVDGIIDSVRTFTYNAEGDIILLETESKTETYIYDASGNLVRVEIDGGNDGNIDQITTYTYDTDNNLIEAVHEIVGFRQELRIYTYDLNGNLSRIQSDETSNGDYEYESTFTWAQSSIGPPNDDDTTNPSDSSSSSSGGGSGGGGGGCFISSFY